VPTVCIAPQFVPLSTLSKYLMSVLSYQKTRTVLPLTARVGGTVVMLVATRFWLAQLLSPPASSANVSMVRVFAAAGL
jgi:hypothetical protein